MQSFSRRGFQLRTSSIETRLAFTAFLLLMVPGVATLLSLSVGRVGFNPGTIAAYYRGGASEMSFPKTFWQLMEVSHFHLFSIPVVVLILSHLLYATPASPRFRIWLTIATYSGALLETSGPWAVRYLSGIFAWVLLLGWILLGGGCLLMVALSLVAMWGPVRLLAQLFPPPDYNGEEP